MLGTHDLWAFLLASFLLWIPPGPDNMYILARSVVLNPKVAVFFLAFLPQFVDPGWGGGPLPILLLGRLFVIVAATATSALRRSPRLLVWLERLSGGVYIALGLNLLRSRPHSA